MRKVMVFATFLLIAVSSMTLGCSEPEAKAILVPKSSNLANGTVTISPLDWGSQSFNVTGKMLNAKVVGTFRASGGSGNDIIVLVMDEMDYINWSNGHEVRVLYSSGQLTTGNINAAVGTPGKYRLVFSNMFSLLTSKKVTSKIDLRWSEKAFIK